MTENEALEILNNECNDISKVQIALKVAREALEEIQAYRAIGIVEDIEKSMQNVSVLLAEHELLKLYQSIGTIDEFKALKEKSVAKKPLFSTVNRETAYHCGSCKKFVGFYDTRKYEYCHNCGTKIDWS